MEILARAVASCPTLKHIELCSFYRCESNQSKIDILTRALGACQALESLTFDFCFQPSVEAFRQLCESPVTELRLKDDVLRWSCLETELFRFLSLESVVLSKCGFTLAQSCLQGLVKHPSVAKICFVHTQSLFRGHGEHSNRDFAALDRLLASRARQNSSISLHFCDAYGLSTNLLFDLASSYDVLEALSFECHIMDSAKAEKMASYLISAKNLRKFVSPYPESHEAYLRILDGLRQNRTLRDLTIYAKAPKMVLEALHENKKLRSLTLMQLGGIPSEGYDFSGLRYLWGLCCLDLRSFSFDHVGRDSLAFGLSQNTKLEEIAFPDEWYDAEYEEVSFYLDLNRWFNQHCAELLQSPENFGRGVWPFILERVAFNVNALHCLVRGHPAIAEHSACCSRKRRKIG